MRRQLNYLQAKKMRRLTSSTGWHAAKKILRTRVQVQSNAGTPLTALFWQLRRMRTSFLRDRIPALQSICTPEDMSTMLMDHQVSVASARISFSLLALQRGDNLESLSIACSCDKDPSEDGESVPSWAIDFKVGERQRRRPLLLGLFMWPAQPRIYASLGVDSKFTIAEITQDKAESSVLPLTGLAFDVVAKILLFDTPLPPPVGAQFDPHKSLKLLNKSIGALFQDIETHRSFNRSSTGLFGSSVSSVEARWRTLLADQWPMGQRLGDGLFLGHKLPTTNEEEKTFLQQVDIDHYDLPFIQGRALIVTERGHLGLASDRTRSGDQVFMLAGGQVPYVLRREADRCYELVGEW